MKNKVVKIDVKAWGRDASYNARTGRKDVMRFVFDSVGEKEVSRLEKIRIGKNSLAVELIMANDELSGEKRRSTIRQLLKKGGLSAKFVNVTRHTADQARTKRG